MATKKKKLKMNLAHERLKWICVFTLLSAFYISTTRMKTDLFLSLFLSLSLSLSIALPLSLHRSLFLSLSLSPSLSPFGSWLALGHLGALCAQKRGLMPRPVKGAWLA